MNQPIRKIPGRLGWLAAASIAALAWTHGAMAAEAATGDAAPAAEAGRDPSSFTSLEEVVVTARRHEENLQSTPISITAFSANALAAKQVDNISQISTFTPNLVFNNSAAISGSRVASSVFIRGIGQLDFTLVTDPGVGLYVDGVYVARSVGGVLDLVDVDRIEVLRGPQGTLFGKNTIGGAISITSKAPSREFLGDIELKTGTGQRADAKLMVSGPLSDTLGARLSLGTFHQDGYVTNVGGGKKLGDTNATVGRLSLEWRPTDAAKVIFAADATVRDETAQPARIIAFNPAGGAPTFGPFNGVVAPAIGVAPYDARYLAGGPFVTYAGNTSYLKSLANVYGTSLTASYDFGGLTVKSISSYRQFTSKFGRDPDNSPLRITGTFDSMDQKQYSQELQATGVNFDHKLEWTVGAFYFKETGSNLNIVPTAVIDIYSGGSIDNKSVAVYGHASYALTSKLRVSGGVRYTNEDKAFLPDQHVYYNQYSALFGGAGFTNGQLILPHQTYTDSFDNVSGQAGLDYQLTPNILLYASFSQGFKSGGFNQRVFPPRSEPGSFAPEKADVYEIGAKLSNPSKTLQLNGALFYTHYDDIQVKIIDVVAPGLGNAANGRIEGGEVELQAVPVKNLHLEASVGVLDTKYTRFAADFDPSQGITTHNRFPNSPKLSLSGAGEYTWALSGLGDVTARVDVTHRSKTYFDAANSPRIAQPELTLVNAGLTFRSEDGKWQAALQVRNLTDKLYFTAGNDEYNGFGYVERQYARPREWSLSLKRSF